MNESKETINRIVGDLAWEFLRLADIENLDENPRDSHLRSDIRQALAAAFAQGVSWAMAQKVVAR